MLTTSMIQNSKPCVTISLIHQTELPDINVPDNVTGTFMTIMISVEL